MAPDRTKRYDGRSERNELTMEGKSERNELTMEGKSERNELTMEGKSERNELTMEGKSERNELTMEGKSERNELFLPFHGVISVSAEIHLEKSSFISIRYSVLSFAMTPVSYKLQSCKVGSTRGKSYGIFRKFRHALKCSFVQTPENDEKK